MKFNRRLLLTSAPLLLGTIVSCTVDVEIIDDPNDNIDPTTGDPVDAQFHRCSTQPLSDIEVARVEFELSNHAPPPGGVLAANGPAAVTVYVHRIHASNGSGGLPTNNTTAINAQMNVLNAAYSGIATFTLATVDDANNDAWYTATDSGTAQTQMKTALRKGTPD